MHHHYRFADPRPFGVAWLGLSVLVLVTAELLARNPEAAAERRAALAVCLAAMAVIHWALPAALPVCLETRPCLEVAARRLRRGEIDPHPAAD